MLNSAEELLTILQLVTALGLISGLTFLLLAAFYFRRGRTDAYWRQRRQASDRGLRYAFLAILTLGLSGIFCVVSLTVTWVEVDRTPDLSNPLEAANSLDESPLETGISATVPPLQVELDSTESSPTPVPSATPEPTAETPPDEILNAPIIGAAESPSPDLALQTEAEAENDLEVPSEIASDTNTDVLEAEDPPENPAAAPQVAELPAVSIHDVQLQFSAMDDAISDDLQPIQADTSFPANTERLYFFFSYANVQTGLRWNQTLLRDGEIVQRRVAEWGVTPPTGETFFFLGSNEGFAPGVYTLRLSLESNDIPLAEQVFTINP